MSEQYKYDGPQESNYKSGELESIRLMTEIARMRAVHNKALEALGKLIFASEMRRAWDIYTEEEFNEYYPTTEKWIFADVDQLWIDAMEIARAAIFGGEPR